MKTIKRLIITLLLVIPLIVLSNELPKPTNPVSDFANIIDDNEELLLNKSIIDYQNSSGMEICVLTLNEIPNNDDLFDFSVSQFKKWGVGKASSNNGIMLSICMNPKGWRILTGYGAEIVLTDLECGRIGQNKLVPNFKNGDFTKGIVETVKEIQTVIGSDSSQINKKKSDIEHFKQLEKEAKLKKQEQIKQGFFTFLRWSGIILILSIIAYYIIKKYIDYQKLKEESLKYIKDIEFCILKIDKETENNQNLKYIIDIQKEINTYINDANSAKLKFNKTNNKILKICSTNLSINLDKIKKFNFYHNQSLKSHIYLNEYKNYLDKINNIQNELSFYNLNFKSSPDIKNFESLIIVLKDNIGTKEMISYMDRIHDKINYIKNLYNELVDIKQSIPRKEKELNNFERNIDSWITKLSSYELNKDIEKVIQMKAELIVLLSLNSSFLFKKYEQYKNIEKYVDDCISKEERRIQKIKDEERRKKREKEEKENQRNSYYSGYNSYNDYSSSSSSSGGSSWGGFGGGDTGGGGAGGSW